MKMTLKIFGTDGTELLSVPFDTDHVTWAIRNSGYCGAINESKIAQYIGEIVWRAGNDWERQKLEWIKAQVGARYQPGADMAALDQQVRDELATWLGWNALPGHNDDGSPIETTK